MRRVILFFGYWGQEQVIVIGAYMWDNCICYGWNMRDNWHIYYRTIHPHQHAYQKVTHYLQEKGISVTPTDRFLEPYLSPIRPKSSEHNLQIVNHVNICLEDVHKITIGHISPKKVVRCHVRVYIDIIVLQTFSSVWLGKYQKLQCHIWGSMHMISIVKPWSHKPAYINHHNEQGCINVTKNKIWTGSGISYGSEFDT